jgi:hypothetical protein
LSLKSNTKIENPAEHHFINGENGVAILIGEPIGYFLNNQFGV